MTNLNKITVRQFACINDYSRTPRIRYQWEVLCPCCRVRSVCPAPTALVLAALHVDAIHSKPKDPT